MRYRYFSVVYIKLKPVNLKLGDGNHQHDDLLFLFQGFTDGKGNFFIILGRYFVKFRFKISLLMMFKFLIPKNLN